jgi:MarR family transcriptional regulator, temperature-dependent positive regulator of motility
VPETQPAAPAALSDDIHYRLLKLLEERPDASQRQLSAALGISLGKINYCVKALLDQGWIKATNFKNSKNKLAYVYLLTPSGVDAKARITARFLKRKIEEHQALKAEIARLRVEVAAASDASPGFPDNTDSADPRMRNGQKAH